MGFDTPVLRAKLRKDLSGNMTTWNSTTDLKAGINTSEKLLAFAITSNLKMYSAKEYNEVEGQLPSPVLTGSIIRAADGSYRLIGRFSLILSEEFMSNDNNQLWELVQEWGTVDFPAEYKAA